MTQRIDRLLTDDQFAELFLELTTQLPEQRVVGLAQLRAEDGERAVALERLFAAHDQHPDQLQTFDPVQAAELLRTDDEQQRPDHAGPFQLRHELGRGGIGVVYLGERNDLAHREFAKLFGSDHPRTRNNGERLVKQ